MTKHKINHSFKPKVFVPMLAVSNNIDFISNDNEEKMVMMNDSTIARVKKYEKLHILSPEAESAVSEIYSIDLLTYLRKWYNVMDITTMEFLLIELEKVEKKNE